MTNLKARKERGNFYKVDVEKAIRRELGNTAVEEFRGHYDAINTKFDGIVLFGEGSYTSDYAKGKDITGGRGWIGFSADNLETLLENMKNAAWEAENPEEAKAKKLEENSTPTKYDDAIREAHDALNGTKYYYGVEYPVLSAEKISLFLYEKFTPEERMRIRPRAEAMMKLGEIK